MLSRASLAGEYRKLSIRSARESVEQEKLAQAKQWAGALWMGWKRMARPPT